VALPLAWKIPPAIWAMPAVHPGGARRRRRGHDGVFPDAGTAALPVA
jgi:hypothetical protein